MITFDTYEPVEGQVKKYIVKNCLAIDKYENVNACIHYGKGLVHCKDVKECAVKKMIHGVHAELAKEIFELLQVEEME